MTTMLNRPLLLLGILSTLIVTTLPGASLHASDAVPDTPPISGIVVREDGTPIAGATVMAAGVDWDPDRRELLDRTRTTTDEHGRFRLSGAVIYPAWGSQWITAVADGCAAASSPATLRERELRFVLRPETRLPVRVLDTQGKGVPGVRLLIWDAVDRRSTREKPDPAARSIAAGTGVSSLLAAPTDQDGRTVVRSLPRGGHVSLMVQDRKWVQRLVRGEEVLRRVLLPDGPAAAEEVFRVGPAGVVEGRLRTEAGQPLAGYRVSVGTGFPGGLIAPTTTDAQGRFRLDGLPAGRVQLLGGTHPALQDFLPGVLDLSLIAGEHRRDCDIVCRRGTLVTGRLLDAANGKPVAGASISAGRPGGDCVVMFGVGDSDASGRFRFRLAPGRWLLNLRLPSEYDDGRSQLVDAERFRERFEAENGQDRPLGDLRVKLRQLITLRGVVLGVDGKPAPGATVYFRHLEARADSLLLTPHVTAGLDGAFEIPRLRYQDGVFLLRARKGSLATTEDVKFDVREEPGPQTLTLAERPLALLRGRVVDDAGNPVPNSGVVLTEGHTPTGGAIPPYPRTDAKGEFEIEVWPNEEYLLYVGAEGHGFAKSAPFRPRPGVNVYPPLVIQRANSFLEVVTVDEEGRPVANVDIQFTIPTGYPYHFPTDGRTDRKGRLRVERVVPGEYDVRANLPDGSRYGMGQARAGETAVRIVVRRSPGGPALPQP